jgi:hypothetical protein
LATTWWRHCGVIGIVMVLLGFLARVGQLVMAAG